MATYEQARKCRCGTRLARDNRGVLCHACAKAARNHLIEPPRVPAGFWQTSEMQAALATCDMGAVIRAFRTHPFHGRDISQQAAAAWVGITQTRLSRIENGEQITNLHKLMRWAHVLGIPSDLLWFRMPSASAKVITSPLAAQPEQQRSNQESQRPSSGPESAMLLPVLINGRPVLVPLDSASVAASGLGSLLEGLTTGGTPTGRLTDATEWDDMPISRRSLLAHGIAAAALPSLALGEAEHVARAVADARRYLDGDAVEYFGRQLEAAKADDGRLGPKRVLPVVLGILGAVERMAREARPTARRALLAVGARGAEFAGWLYRDVHDQAAAVFWHDRATEWAQEAGDFSMQGYVLLKKAQMAYDDRDAVRVLTLAQAAQEGPWRLPPKVRAEVAQQEARGLAMLGEPMAAVESKLDEARQHFARFTGDDGSQLGTHYSGSSLTLQTASCYIEAGKPQRAAALYEDVLRTGALSQRDQGYFLARRASALALSGEPDDAAAVGLESIRLAEATSSARTKRELGRAIRTLQPWASRPGPRELREAVLAQ